MIKTALLWKIRTFLSDPKLLNGGVRLSNSGCWTPWRSESLSPTPVCPQLRRQPGGAHRGEHAGGARPEGADGPRHGGVPRLVRRPRAPPRRLRLGGVVGESQDHVSAVDLSLTSLWPLFELCQHGLLPPPPVGVNATTTCLTSPCRWSAVDWTPPPPPRRKRE